MWDRSASTKVITLIKHVRRQKIEEENVEPRSKRKETKYNLESFYYDCTVFLYKLRIAEAPSSEKQVYGI